MGARKDLFCDSAEDAGVVEKTPGQEFDITMVIESLFVNGSGGEGLFSKRELDR